MPDCCVQCSLCCADYKGELYCKQLDETFKPNIEVVDYKKRKRNCPLKLLSDHIAEVRKMIVQEIRDWCSKNFNWVGDGTGYDGQDYNEMIGSNNTINKLREKLDQIERGK